jgi:hypothetical protein
LSTVLDTEYRRQKTEDRRQKTEYRIQNTEYRIQNTEYRIHIQNTGSVEDRFRKHIQNTGHRNTETQNTDCNAKKGRTMSLVNNAQL